jgi:hypothetical protein
MKNDEYYLLRKEKMRKNSVFEKKCLLWSAKIAYGTLPGHNLYSQNHRTAE